MSARGIHANAVRMEYIIVCSSYSWRNLSVHAPSLWHGDYPAKRPISSTRARTTGGQKTLSVRREHGRWASVARKDALQNVASETNASVTQTVPRQKLRGKVAYKASAVAQHEAGRRDG